MILPLLLACRSTDDSARPSSDDTETGEEDTARGGDSGDSTAPDDSGDTDTAVVSDEDGDGHSPLSGDCDDNDARVYPGARDACDALDQDCDGEAAPPGSCGELVPLVDSAVGWWDLDYDIGELLLGEADTDYTGDGVVDMLAFAACVELRGAPSCNLNVVLLPGAFPDGESAPAAGSAFWAAEPGRDYIGDFGNAGDFDGDGSVDLFVTSRGAYPDLGSVYLIAGPASGWPTDGAYLSEAASGWWEQAEYNDWFGDDAAGGNDVDGDGLADLMVTTTGTEEDGWAQGALSVILGRSGALPEGAPIMEEIWFENDMGMGTLAMLPDMDGDGIGEAALDVSYAYAPNTLGFLSIEVLRTGSSGVLVSNAVDAVQFDESTVFLLLDGRSELGDTNNDGFTDIAFRLAKELTGDGVSDYCTTTLQGGTDLRTGDPDDRLGGIACFPGAGSYPTTDKLGGDADGDGVPDMVFSDTGMGGGSYAGCIVPSSRLPASGTVLAEEVRPYCFGSTTDTEVFRWGGSADLDKDGFPELLASEPLWDDGALVDVGRILVAPGFEIPWGDASRW
ncbi:MAG: putative metal-binding motif-containing protein [Pseudomonadota bacterium]|nr:putative metal-binding motif-containing protein [Pseudomonadota bacterium]